MKDAGKFLIISDLHLGNGGTYDIFAGGDALPALLQRFAAPGNTILLNGDSVDFLMNEDPLELNEARALLQAEQAFSAPATAAVLKALGGVLAAGGNVQVRLGNHDIELALLGVQERMRQALGQPPAVAARMQFARGEQPAILTVSGARILITHGEQSDGWNKVDYLHLPGPGAPPDTNGSNFAYAVGSRLVKTIMNPLKRQYGLRLIDLIKPDFQGGVLTALAINPSAVKEVFKGSTLQLLWQLRKQSQTPSTFMEDGDLGLSERLHAAGLDDGERQTMAEFFAAAEGPQTFDFDTAAFASAQLKLVRAGLRLYAGAQRQFVGDAGQRFFALNPDPDEWNEATRLAKKYQTGAVIFGHTHAARWQAADSLIYANTGTWIHMLSLPAPDASNEEWANFLELARKNPRLDPKVGAMVPLFTRFTAALIEPDADKGGAQMSLVEWTADGTLRTHSQGHVPATPGAPSA